MDNGNLPYVGDTLLEYFQPMVFTTIVKSTVNFQVVETPTSVSFRGVWQPYSAQRLSMKPHGQRDWSNFQLHSDTTLTLVPDDVVTYLGTQYRVMGKLDYSKYGFYEYHLTEDYSGSGPS